MATQNRRKPTMTANDDDTEPSERESGSYPIPTEHLAAIGRAADTWNQMEFLVDRAIWKLVHVEQPVVACLTSQFNGIFPRMNALISLVTLFRLSDEAAKQFKQQLGKLSTLSAARNRIIHDPRFVANDQDIIRFEVVGGKTSLRFGSEPETIEALDLFRDDVNKARQNFLSTWELVATAVKKQPQLLRAKFNKISLDDLE